MNTHPVCVVVPTWNSRDVIGACLESALRNQPSKIVVVDNGSSDGTVDFITTHFPQCEILRNPANLGFSHAANRGIEACDEPFVLLLNDDAVLAADYIECLVKALDRQPRAASAVGKLLSKRGDETVIDSAGITLVRYALRPEDRGHGEADRGQYGCGEEVFGGSGAALLLRRAALESLGAPAFDEALFAYYEDVDLAWRLRRGGWTHWYEPAAVGWHVRRGPNTKPWAIRGRAFGNRYLVWLKNESALRFLSYSPIALPWEAARIARIVATTGTPILHALASTLPRAARVLHQRCFG